MVSSPNSAYAEQFLDAWHLSAITQNEFLHLLLLRSRLLRFQVANAPLTPKKLARFFDVKETFLCRWAFSKPVGEKPLGVVVPSPGAMTVLYTNDSWGRIDEVCISFTCGRRVARTHDLNARSGKFSAIKPWPMAHGRRGNYSQQRCEENGATW